MSYTKQEKEKALEVYLQTRTVEAVSKICNTPYSTLRRWSLKYHWKEKLEDYQNTIAENPFEENQELQEYIKGFDISKEDGDLLNQIKTVEGICFASMREDVPDDRIHLKPRSFKEAVEALNICWKARENLLHRDKKASVTVNGPAKFDFIGGGQR